MEAVLKDILTGQEYRKLQMALQRQSIRRADEVETRGVALLYFHFYSFILFRFTDLPYHR
jgi:hypothetical protein